MSNIDYDPYYEWLCEKADKLDQLSKAWLKETIGEDDNEEAVDELYIPCGDHLAPVLLAVGKRFPGFEEALAEALYDKCYKAIDGYVDSVTDWYDGGW